MVEIGRCGTRADEDARGDGPQADDAAPTGTVNSAERASSDGGRPRVSDLSIAQVKESEQDLLVLSTIHSAKGLEWHTVFVIWLAEGRFPSMYAVDDEESLEEELRLLYVATTRAKQNLYLSYPAYDNQWGNYFSRPSRFLEGISRNNLEQWSLFEEADDRYDEDDV